MKSPLAFVILLALFLSFAIAGAILIESAAATSSPQARAFSEQAAFEKREAAYRANNLGVAMLEQYKAKDAVEYFTRALEIKPDLLIARVNLSIALYYLPDAKARSAKRQRRWRRILMRRTFITFWVSLPVGKIDSKKQSPNFKKF